MDKIKIAWLTPDHFYDVDWPIITMLKTVYEIRWYVIWAKGTKRELPKNQNIYSLIELPYSFVDLRMIGSYSAILSEIKIFAPDIVYTGFEGFPYFMPMLFHLVDERKTVLAGHETNPLRRGARSWPFRVYLKYIIKHIGHIQVFSKFAEEEFLSLYPGKACSYVPMVPKDYGAPIEHLDYRNKKVFLFFGSIRPDKRLDVLLKAFVSLGEEYTSKCVLLVYGNVNHVNRDEIEQIVSGSENVELHLGFVPDNLVATLFTSADYLVLPYQQVSQSGPNMIAYNYGLPIIASDIKGFTERITDGRTGYLFHVNDVDSLRWVLKNAIDQSKEDYDLIKKNMMDWVRLEYSPEVVVAKYQAMFDGIKKSNTE